MRLSLVVLFYPFLCQLSYLIASKEQVSIPSPWPAIQLPSKEEGGSGIRFIQIHGRHQILQAGLRLIERESTNMEYSTFHKVASIYLSGYMSDVPSETVHS